MRFLYKKKEQAAIPTASMADIAFLLIIFFMVTTIFRAEQGLKVFIPKAEATNKLPKKNIAHIWVSEEGLISIDDNLVRLDQVRMVMKGKMLVNPNLITSILADQSVSYGVMNDVFEQLQHAEAYKVSLTTKKKTG
jgi:biopolymer transport protein ExbD